MAAHRAAPRARFRRQPVTQCPRSGTSRTPIMAATCWAIGVSILRHDAASYEALDRRVNAARFHARDSWC